jgi:hypothetical protein
VKCVQTGVPLYECKKQVNVGGAVVRVCACVCGVDVLRMTVAAQP